MPLPKRTNAVVEERPGEVRLFIPALPGFMVTSPDVSAALEIAGNAIGGFLAWLHAYELSAPVDAAAPLVVAETLAAQGSSGPIFTSDREALKRDPFELSLAIGRVMLGDLIDLFEGVNSVEGRLSAEAALRQIAERDRWHAGRLGFVSQTPPSRDVVDDLVAAAGDFEDAADAAFASGRNKVVTTDGEAWSLAKLLRRRTGYLGEQLSRLNRS